MLRCAASKSESYLCSRGTVDPCDSGRVRSELDWSLEKEIRTNHIDSALRVTDVSISGRDCHVHNMTSHEARGLRTGVFVA